MSIRIREDRCVGCGKCQEVCPGTLIQIKDKKAVMKYPKNCWGCVSCVKECKMGAIEFYLGADIGGICQGSGTHHFQLQEFFPQDPGF